MAIITKPVGGILKGVPATITLNKSELSALTLVSADSYFSVTANWNKIILSYKSSEGNQQEIVEFDATLSSPTGFFDVSLKARDLFEIQVIKIIDFDGGIFTIPRSELTTADFDVEFLNPPSNLSYTTPVTYTINQPITNNVPTVTGTVTSYSISPTLPTGLTINPTTGVISGTPTVAVSAANYIVTASNSGGSTTATINITVVQIVTSYLTYELNTAGATLNATGGVSGGNSGDDVYAKDSSGASGDFTYEWKFNWSSINPFNVLFGVTGTYSSGSWFGNLTCLEGVSGTNPEKARLWVNGIPGVVTNITIPDGDNLYKLVRVGTTVTHYLNGVSIYSSSVPLFTAYPTVRTKGLVACSESYVPLNFVD